MDRKRGIYTTGYGNAAFVDPAVSTQTAYDLDMGEPIPMSAVTGEFIREAEDSDVPDDGWNDGDSDYIG